MPMPCVSRCSATSKGTGSSRSWTSWTGGRTPGTWSCTTADIRPRPAACIPRGLGRLAVRKSYRGCGLGARMVEELGRKAAELGASVSQLDAQTRARGFYEKQGYRVCGEEHMDGHVPHVMMEKKLDGISNGFLGK